MNRFSLLAASSLFTLFAAGCSDEGAIQPSNDAGVPVAPVAKRTRTHSLVLGTHEQIAERRTSLAPKYARNVVPKSGLKAPAASPFIPSSGTFFANPRKDGDLRVTLRHDALSLLQGASRVESSDIGVASASLQGSDVIVTLSGKLGNSFVTTFDVSGNALAKFMVLAATPREGVAIIDDEAIEPAHMFLGSADSAWPVTDFGAMTDTGSLNALYNGATGYITADANRFSDEKLGKLVAAVNEQVGSGVQAIYFPGRDILVKTPHNLVRAAFWDRTYKTQDAGYTEGIYITGLVAQDHFADYVDYGNVLTSSPLHDPNQEESGGLEFVPTKSQLQAGTSMVAVILADGTRVDASAPNFEDAKSKATRAVYAYGEDEGFECSVKVGSSINWRSVSTSASTKLSGHASWNGGKPDLGLELRPQLTFGGQFELSAGAVGSCERKLFTIPIAEWGLPVFGNVALNVPVAAKFEVSVTNSSTKLDVMTPRQAIGSKADPSKPGTVAFGYSVQQGGFYGTFDVGAKTDFTALGVAVGSDAGPSTVDVEAGVAAAFGFEATVKLWIAKASVRADIGNVLFGVDTSAKLETKTNAYSVKEGEFNLGLFPHIAPTISIDAPFWHHSFNLFDMQVAPIKLLSLSYESEDSELLPEEKASTIQVDGRTLKIVYSAESVRIDDLRQSDNAYYVLAGWATRSCGSAPQAGRGTYMEYARIPFVNGVANITGYDLRNADFCKLDYSGQYVAVNNDKAFVTPYGK